MYKSQIKATGSYLPPETITNTDLEKILDTNHEWIIERTGIASRHKATEESCSDMCVKAAQQAFQTSGLKPEDIDMVLVATLTPDYLMPNMACLVKQKLNLPKKGMAVDLSAACTGFVYVMAIADQFIRTGACQNILLLGGEVLTSLVDYEDRSTCILFGDGAGAMILGRAKEGSEIYSHYLYSDGDLGDLIKLPAGGSLKPITKEVLDKKENKMFMNGREVFKNAVQIMPHCSKEVLKGHSIDDVDWLIPHQANLRIMDAVAKRLHIRKEKVIIEIKNMGNTSAATIPISFDRAIRDGRIKRGHNVLLTAFGGGLTGGSLYLKY